MLKNEMTAAQRIMLSKGQEFYIPKPISLNISAKNELILVMISLLLMIAFFILNLVKNIFGNNTNYGTTLFLFVYIMIFSYDCKNMWKKYNTNKI